MLLPQIKEEFLGLFSGALFYCSNDINPMHFVLSLKNGRETEKDGLIVLMRHCGAEISLDLKEATKFSILLVDHEDVVKFHGPAFTIEFIKDCLESEKMLDISKYRQNATKHIAAGYDCMSVVYFRDTSWESVITEKEKKWIDTHATDSCPCGSQISHSHSSLDDDHQQISTRIDTHATDSCPCGSQSSHSLSSLDDDHQQISTRFVASTVNSETITERDVEVNSTERTKQNVSMKYKIPVKKSKGSGGGQSDGHVGRISEELVKTGHRINVTETCSKATNTAVYSGKELADKIKTVLKETQTTQSTVSAKSSSHSSQRKKWKFLDEFLSSDSSEEEQPDNLTKQDFLNDFEPDESVNEDQPVRSNKRSRKPYSVDERTDIIKYIVKHNEYGRVKGKDLWIIMERRKICPSRTWQSMKEHFIKKIIFDLDEYPFLSTEQKNRIKRVCF